MKATLRWNICTPLLLGVLALICFLPCYTGAYFWWKKTKLLASRFERLADKPRITIHVNNTHPLYWDDSDEITWESDRVDIIERHYQPTGVTLIGYIDQEETTWWNQVYQGWKKMSKENTRAFFLSWYHHQVAPLPTPNIRLLASRLYQPEHTPTCMSIWLESPKKPPRC